MKTAEDFAKKYNLLKSEMTMTKIFRSIAEGNIEVKESEAVAAE